MVNDSVAEATAAVGRSNSITSGKTYLAAAGGRRLARVHPVIHRPHQQAAQCGGCCRRRSARRCWVRGAWSGGCRPSPGRAMRVRSRRAHQRERASARTGMHAGHVAARRPPPHWRPTRGIGRHREPGHAALSGAIGIQPVTARVAPGPADAEINDRNGSDHATFPDGGPHRRPSAARWCRLGTVWNSCALLVSVFADHLRGGLSQRFRPPGPALAPEEAAPAPGWAPAPGAGGRCVRCHHRG